MTCTTETCTQKINNSLKWTCYMDWPHERTQANAGRPGNDMEGTISYRMKKRVGLSMTCTSETCTYRIRTERNGRAIGLGRGLTLRGHRFL